MEKIKILVVDDHPIFLKGLIEVLQDEVPEADIMPQPSAMRAISATTALSLVPSSPVLAILDLDMPDMNGIALAAKLKEIIPTLKVIILTMHKEPDIVRSVLARGIEGYVFKDDAVNDLVKAIAEVRKGKIFAPLPSKGETKTSPLWGAGGQIPSITRLTKTEILVLTAIAEQKTSREIAAAMFVSLKTIENHRNNISRKLNLNGSNSLLKFALENKAFLVISPTD
ncbi:MAG: hypothetical protein RL757_1200 [Bacteroidota bacterium]|jgi:DNA-binding NarL/FixJ family response regulator